MWGILDDHRPGIGWWSSVKKLRFRDIQPSDRQESPQEKAESGIEAAKCQGCGENVNPRKVGKELVCPVCDVFRGGLSS